MLSKPQQGQAAQYVGTLFDAEAQSRHTAGSLVGRRRLTLGISMALSVAGIVGCIQHALVDGTRHGLD